MSQNINTKNINTKKINTIIRTAQTLRIEYPYLPDEVAIELATKMYENLEKIIEKYQK